MRSCQITSWILPGKFVEVPNQMRLVIVSAFVGNRTPPWRLVLQRLEYFLKSINACQQLWTNSHDVQELSPQMTTAEPDGIDQFINRHTPVGLRNSLCG